MLITFIKDHNYLYMLKTFSSHKTNHELICAKAIFSNIVFSTLTFMTGKEGKDLYLKSYFSSRVTPRIRCETHLGVTSQVFRTFTSTQHSPWHQFEEPLTGTSSFTTRKHGTTFSLVQHNALRSGPFMWRCLPLNSSFSRGADSFLPSRK